MQINVQAADWACCESAAWTGPNSSAWTIRFPSWAEHSTQCSGAILCTCIHRQLYFCHFHCCQVSTKLHGQFEKKNSAKYRKKGCIVNYFVNTKFTTHKVDFLSKLPMKKLKIVLNKNIFQFGVVRPREFLDLKDFLRPLLSYFAEFSATWQQ